MRAIIATLLSGAADPFGAAAADPAGGADAGTAGAKGHPKFGTTASSWWSMSPPRIRAAIRSRA